MEKWLGPAVGVLALVLVGWNAWTLSGIEARLDALEDRAVEAPSAVVADGRREDGGRARPTMERRAARRAARDGEAAADGPISGPARDAELVEVNLDDPAMRDRIAAIVAEHEDARREEEEAVRSERFVESMTFEVERFADEHGYDERTTSAVMAEMTRRHEAFSTIRQDIHDGNISWIDGRKEMETLREEGDTRMSAIIGEEDAEALETALFGDRDRRRGPP